MPFEYISVAWARHVYYRFPIYFFFSRKEMRKKTTNIIFSHGSFRDVINLFKLKISLFDSWEMVCGNWKVDSILRSILSGMLFLCKTISDDKEGISFFCYLLFTTTILWKKKSFCYLQIQIASLFLNERWRLCRVVFFALSETWRSHCTIFLHKI